MKVAVVFTQVIGKADYKARALRWLASYREHRTRTDYPHDLVIINRYADSPDGLFDTVATMYLRYDLDGWDCGSWQFAAKSINADLLVCCNSSTWITGPGWMKRFVDAFEQNGPGLYGPMASYELNPHIRTPCMVFPPRLIADYPMEVLCRDDTWRFEVFGFPNGTPNVTQWVRARGHKTMLVTWDGVYDLPDWRKPPNIFRRGDQSNLIVKDWHCDIYAASDAEEKNRLEAIADGK